MVTCHDEGYQKELACACKDMRIITYLPVVNIGMLALPCADNGAPKVELPFGTLISFGFLCFHFAFGQGTPTENAHGGHKCFLFFGVKRVPV